MGGTINLTGVPDFDQFEIVKEGSVSVTVTPGVFDKTTIAHNLGFVPWMLAAFDNVNVVGIFSDGDMMLPTWTNLTLDNVNHVIKWGSYIQTATDSTNGYIMTSSALAASQGPYTIKYYLIRKRSR